MSRREKGKARRQGNQGRAGKSAKTSSGDTSGASEEKKRDGPREWVKSIAFAVIFFLVIRGFVVQTFVITSGSMEETLLVGDFLIVNRASMGRRIPLTSVRVPALSSPHRGDVLVFDPPHEEKLKLVKRLIGAPGDTVQMRAKKLYLNGELQDEPYARYLESTGDEAHPWMEWQRDYLTADVDRATYAPTRDSWGPIVVPEGYYFMLGDNRDRSLDSRYWGLLERWRLEGRVSLIYFSYDREALTPFAWLRKVRWGRIASGID